MFRIVILLLIIAAVAGYFTRPSQAALEAAANAEMNVLENIGNTLLGERAFSDYYVATRYVVTLNDETLVQCWGVYQQTLCTRPAAE